MPSVTPQDRARMVMLRGLGYEGTEIAEMVGFSESTVYDHLGDVEDAARAADDPYATFTDYYMAYVFGPSFRETVSMLLSP